MALQKQNFALSIVDGLDTKTDAKNVVPTRFLELENLIFTKTGSLSKRLGYRALPAQILNGADVTSGAALSNYGPELLMYSENQLYTFSEAEQKWALKGNANLGLSSISVEAATGEILSAPYFAKLDSFTLVAYQFQSQLSTGIKWVLKDSETQTILGSGSVASGSRPRVSVLNNKFILTYADSATVYYTAINPVDLTSATPVAVTATTTQYDCLTLNNRLYFLACLASGVRILFLDNNFLLSSPISVETSGSFTQPHLSPINTTDVRVAYVDSGLDLNFCVYPPSLTIKNGAGVTALPVNTWTATGLSKGSYTQFYASSIYEAAPANQNTVYKFTITDAGVVSTHEVLFYQTLLQTKATTLNGKDYFVIVKDESNLGQRTVRTYFLANSDGQLLSKFDEENSLVLLKQVGTQGYLTEIETNGQSIIFTGASLAEVQSELDTANSRLLTPTSIKLYTTDFSAVSNYFDAKLGENLHVVGGLLKAYDGNKIVEHGFLEIPRAPTYTVNSNGPTPGLGLPSAISSYQYQIVYAWRDAKGQLHRSAPSPAATVSVPQAAPNYSEVELELPTLSLTNKTDVEIEVYRTEANGTNFYKVLVGGILSYDSRVFNDPAQPTITFADSVPDDVLITNELLYATGGVLENTAALSSKYAVTYKNRVLLLTSDGRRIQYSKLREQNGPVEFNDSLVIQLDEFGGVATGLAVLDDNVIVFKERAIFTFTGEGPNNLGEQDDFRQPYLISSDAGCIEPTSIVRTPDSIMFKSEKGIYQLARGLAVGYIGAPVEAYNSLQITSANLLDNTNEVRFTTEGGRALVYDYFHRYWTTFTNVKAIDATLYEGRLTYLRTVGTVLRETPDYYLDNGSYIKTKLVSAWISLAGIQGYERFYQMLILGAYKSSHQLKVAFAYDFVDAYTHSILVGASAVLGPSPYGSEVYGDESPYGGPNMRYQFRFFPKKQKCEAFKIKIEDFNEDLLSGEAFTLSNISAIVGVKTGQFKLGAGRSFGA